MNAIATGKGVPRGELVLPRLLATILFALGAIFGLPAILVIAVAPFSGEWRPALVATAFLPGAWGLVWLGRVLWSGRPIPRWFIFVFYLAMAGLPIIMCAVKGEWGFSLLLLVLGIPFLQMFWPGRSPAGKKPPGIHDLDELA